MGCRYGIWYIDMVILDIDKGYGVIIWEMTVSIWSSPISIWDSLSLCKQSPAPPHTGVIVNKDSNG